MTILDSMTDEAAKAWDDLKEKRTHPFPCDCPACLYAQYEKEPRRKRGKFRPTIFFLNWLIHRTKMQYLIKRGKAEKISFQGRECWKFETGEYDKAPYFKRSQEILSKLLNEKKDFPDLLDSLTLYYKRTTKPNFLKLLDKLYDARWLEWIKIQPPNQNLISTKDIAFAGKASAYIRLKGKISQRDLLRHFSKNRLQDFNKIENLLLTTGIERKKKQKTLYYEMQRIKSILI
jgi:hypothetical protein